MKNNIKNILKKILICVIVFMSCIPTNKVDAWFWQAERIMWITLFDTETYTINYMLYEQEKSKLESILKTIGNGEEIPDFGHKASEGIASKGSYEYAITIETDTSTSAINRLIFPAISIDETGNGNKRANSKDYEQAEKVIGALTQSLNSAIAFVREGDMNATDTKNLTDVAKIAEKLTLASKSGKTTYISSSVYMTEVNKDSNISLIKKASEKADKELNQIQTTWGMGATESNYRILVNTSNNTAIPIMVSSPTGYGKEQYLANGKYTYDDISWQEIVTVATTALENNVTADNGGFEVIGQSLQGSLEEALSELGDKIAKVLSPTLLGFYSLEGMVLNRGTRGSSYYLGMMPNSWFQQSNNIFWIMEIIAVFILLASVLYSVFKQNYAIVSPKERINLQDRIQNLLISIILLLLYVPLFYVIAKFNQSVVEMLDSLVVGKEFSSAANVSWILKLVMAVVDLFIIIKLNIDYLIRALTITLLHAISPVMIASLSLTDNGRGLFNTWLKEMVCAIFMQTFDAVILVLFMLVSETSGTSRWWEMALMTFAFIPMNQWFKQTFGGSGGISNMASGTQKGATTAINSAATGMSIATNLKKGSSSSSSLDSERNAQKEKETNTGTRDASRTNGGAGGKGSEPPRGSIVAKAGGTETEEGNERSSQSQPSTETDNNQSAQQSEKTDTGTKHQSVKKINDAYHGTKQNIKDKKDKVEKWAGGTFVGEFAKSELGQDIKNATKGAAAIGAGVIGTAIGAGTLTKMGVEYSESSARKATSSNAQNFSVDETSEDFAENENEGNPYEGRQYYNNKIQEEYQKDLSENYSNTMNELEQVENEEEWKQMYDEKLAPQMAEELGMSRKEFDDYVKENNLFEDETQETPDTPKETKAPTEEEKKQKLEDEKKKYAETYAKVKTNKNFNEKYSGKDEKHPKQTYKTENIKFKVEEKK